MKEEQRQEHNRQKELEKREGFAVTVLQRTGEQFFKPEHIKDLEGKQWEIFKNAPFASRPALDKMLNKVMSNLHEKHKELIQELKLKDLTGPETRYSTKSEKEKQQKQHQQNYFTKQQEPNNKRQYKKSQHQMFEQGKTPKIEYRNFMEYERDISLQQCSELTQKRRNILVDSYYPKQYKYPLITYKKFKQKYVNHVKDVIVHISKNQYRTSFLTGYILQNHNENDQTIKVKVHMADSDFILTKTSTDWLMVKELKEEKQVLFWMWSFANMIKQMENLGVYHLDLKISNTVKLGRLFRCIDYEYSFLIDDEKTIKSIKAMLSDFNIRDKENQNNSFIFEFMEVQFDTFSLKIFKYFPQQQQGQKDYKWKLAKNDFNQCRQHIKKMPVGVDESVYNTFKKFLKVYHKFSFVYGLLDMVDAATQYKLLSQQTRSQILQNISSLNINNESSVHDQFIGKIKEINDYLKAQDFLQLKYIAQMKNIKDIKDIAVEKFKSISDWLLQLQKRHQIVVPIIPNSVEKQGTSCKIRNTCSYFENADDFWRLFRPRYLYYLIKGMKSALEMLEHEDVYFTSLSIRDIVKEGQFFKIKTLENALMLSDKQQKFEPQVLSRKFIQQLQKAQDQMLEIPTLKFILQTKCFKQVNNSQKILIDDLKNKKWQILFNLLKEIFDAVPEDKNAQFFRKLKVNCSQQLVSIKKLIKNSSSSNLKNDKQESIFKALFSLLQKYSKNNSLLESYK